MLRLIHREFEVDVSLETAWKHLAQIEQWPSWAKHIRKVELSPPGDLTLQSSGTIYLTNGIRSIFRMVEMDPLNHWKWVGPFLWMMVHYDHIFERIDNQRTRLVWVVSGEGLAVSLFGRLYAVIYNRNLDRAIPNLIVELHASHS